MPSGEIRYREILRVVWRNGTVPHHSRYMLSGGIDPDLIEFLFWCRSIRGLADNTVRVRFDLLQRLYLYVGKPLRDLDTDDLYRFERVGIAGRAAESRRSYACHCRAFFRWLQQTGVRDDNPADVLTLPKLPKHLPRPIPEDELHAVLDAARPKMRAMLTLAAYAGLRCAEIAAMCWEDLHRDAGGTYIHVHGKGDRERTVEVGQVVIKALQAHGIRTRGPVFWGYEARPMDARSVSSSINRYLKLQGLEITAHQLRHRYGVIGYQLSHDLRLIQQNLGHSSPATTAIYTRPAADAGARLAELMDAITPAR
jgi:site-specific recombinase XerD